MRSPNAALGLLLGLFLIVFGSDPSRGGTLQCLAYRCHNAYTDECQVEVCDYDEVLWDILSVDIGPGTPAGTYWIDAFNYRLFSNQWVGLVVDQSGGYTVDLSQNGGRYWEGWAPNETTIDWQMSGGTAEGDQVAILPAVCEPRSGVLRHGNVAVFINDSTLALDPNNTKPCDANTACASCSNGMANYSFHLLLASLHIEDTPISYNCPVGPSPDLKVVYNQREGNQPSTFRYSNLGPKWTFNWLSYVSDDPDDPTKASVYVRSGGTEAYTGYDPATQGWEPDRQTLAKLVRTQSLPAPIYEKRFPDGSKEVFAMSDNSPVYPRRIFLSRVADAHGNEVNLSYDTTSRLTGITDSLGQTTMISYVSDDPSMLPAYYHIDHISDPFGRTTNFEYNGYGGQLSKITDAVGIASEFFYAQSSDFINRMHTPYGDTYFTTDQNGNSRWIEALDPSGGRERAEYQDSVGAIPSSEQYAPSGVMNGALNRRNTFYWDKKAMAEGAGDYTKARMIHWLKSSDGTKVSGIKHSEKRARESRVWYNYAGQGDANRAGTNALPIRIARILDDGTTQSFQRDYNPLGNITKSIDPKNRVTSYRYDPAYGIDLLAVYQRTPNGLTHDPDGEMADKIAEYTYDPSDPPHLPRTYMDAARQTTTYSYNSHSQITDVQNARSETTHYEYGSNTSTCSDVPYGYLISVTSPTFNGQTAATNLRYDCARRVHTVTNTPDSYTVTTRYDDLDRQTEITYPDGTSQQFMYTEYDEQGVDTGIKRLDVTKSIDRQGRSTIRHHDGNRRMDWIKDPLLRKTIFNWCACGSLDGIIDANGNATHFEHDLQSRVTSKTYAFGTPQAEVVSYVYENIMSRLKSMTDAMNQTTNYDYEIDDNLSHVTYTNAQNPTPNLTYAYDPYYNRLTSVTSSGSGVLNTTTGYTYYPVGLAGTLGANRVQSVTGTFPTQHVLTYMYDELGRTTSQSVDGSMPSTMHYDSLGRIGVSDNPLGHFARVYENNVTPRIQKVAYPNGQTASYTYFDNTNDRRLQTLQNLTSGSVNLSKFDYTYDSEGTIQTQNKLLGTNQTNLVFGYDNAQQLTSVTQGNLHFQYGYDAAGNRLTDLFSSPFSNGGNSFTANSLNQLDSVSHDLGVGPPQGPFPIKYDKNGNMLHDGGTQEYQWDAANRLITINYTDTGNRTEFAYDGLGRRVRITEYGLGLTADMQPKAGGFMLFREAEFTLSPGSSELKFERVNFNGGHNTANFQASQWVHDETYEQPRATLRGSSGTKTFLWSGNTIVEERDGTGSTVRKRFYPEGEQRVGGSDAGNYYYSRDHLGSIREITNESGNLVARYEYDSWGKSVVVNRSTSADFGFTGHYFHQPSGMNLALYRGYSPTMARWISRDPIGEIGGINLYDYAVNDPVNLVDPTGELPNSWVPRYGYWGGPDWSGGWRPSQHGGANGPQGPIDALDAAAMRHDMAYGRWGIRPGDPNSDCWKIQDLCARDRCYRKQIADNKLINDANALRGHLGSYADWYIRGINWAF